MTCRLSATFCIKQHEQHRGTKESRGWDNTVNAAAAGQLQRAFGGWVGFGFRQGVVCGMGCVW